MADVRFEHSSAGYISLMKSGEMRAVLQGHADAIEGLATAMISPDKFSPPLANAPYASFDFETGERAGVRVQTHNRHADLAERKHGILQSAAGV